MTWYQHAVAYSEMKWPHLAPHSRASLADALATVTPLLTRETGRRPPDRDYAGMWQAGGRDAGDAGRGDLAHVPAVHGSRDRREGLKACPYKAARSVLGDIYGGLARIDTAETAATATTTTTGSGRSRGYWYQLAATVGWTSLPFLPLLRQRTQDTIIAASRRWPWSMRAKSRAGRPAMAEPDQGIEPPHAGPSGAADQPLHQPGVGQPAGRPAGR